MLIFTAAELQIRLNGDLEVQAQGNDFFQFFSALQMLIFTAAELQIRLNGEKELVEYLNRK